MHQMSTLMGIRCADTGCMIHYAMFQRNGRSGYVLKPLALRSPDKALLSKMTKHILDIKVGSHAPWGLHPR